jgi:allophanate hydrolase
MPNPVAAPPVPASLSLSALRQAYTQGYSPLDLVEALYARLPGADPAVWLHLLPKEQARARAAELAAQDPASLPLYGIPFAVKDNIDVEGMPTTAACPAFAYTPERSATVVQRLIEAGAILIGKTNLDQFATGLVGARSPYGAPRSVFNADYISGGSSSGSGVVVAAGLVSFALGTDTAGSGRVPAAFNNIVGAKPTRGYLPCTGVVPACRSLDCVSVFALNAADTWSVMQIAGGDDGLDVLAATPRPRGLPARPRIGVPRPAQREFFGDTLAAAEYDKALQRLASLGELVEFDFAPLAETAALLYEGPWLAERLEACAELFARDPEALDPAVRSVISKGVDYSAAAAFKGRTQLAALQKQIAPMWQDIDLFALPTAPTHYRLSEIEADPLRLNARLGTYTNFANLLDLAAIAVPSSLRADGLPFGITLFAQAWSDAALATLADRLQRLAALPCGATGLAQDNPPLDAQWPTQPGNIRIAVVGAHLSGMPLNRELSERAASFVRACHTAPHYRLYALPGTVPPKPGLIRDTQQGAAIALEVWEMSAAAFGDFVSRIPAPLGIGTLTLDDGEQVKGFLCEHSALAGATDITHYGGWRAYIAGQSRT